ncbi:MAG: DNA gyrase C-terminal beta-propeller domain-containing protein, partial [Alphaproteobacteria bacterium]
KHQIERKRQPLEIHVIQFECQPQQQRDASAEVVLNQLYRFTPLQTSFGVNMLALRGGRPELLTLKDIIVAFVGFREEVIRRRTVFELGKARDKAHTLVGLAIAVANLDEVIRLIRAAPDPATAREQLMARDWPASDVEPLIQLIDEPGREVVEGRYRLSEAQARAILDLRLHRLTGLERDKIHQELREIGVEIEEYLHILSSRKRLYEILRAELVAIREQFATERRTALEQTEFEPDIENLIQREDMVVTVTNTGYIKRVPLSAYRAQRRGGKGRSVMNVREADFVTGLFVASTHAPVLFFSSRGQAYKLKVYRLPLGTPQARGKAMVNLLPLEEGETITAVMPLPEDETQWAELNVMFATATGNVRRNQLSDFTNVMVNGKIAMKLDEGDSLISVLTCTDRDDVLLSTHSGKCIRFAVTDVRVFAGRTSTGVRGIRLAEGDRVISMSMLAHTEYGPEERAAYLRLSRAVVEDVETGGEAMDAVEGGEEEASDVEGSGGEVARLSQERLEQMASAEEFVLTITENGYGKRTSAYEYRVTGRGGQGIVSIETSRRNGAVVASFPIGHSDQIVMVTNAAQLIRVPVDDIRIARRNTQGVTLFRTAGDEWVVSAVRLADMNENESENDGEGGGIPPDGPGEEGVNG